MLAPWGRVYPCYWVIRGRNLCIQFFIRKSIGRPFSLLSDDAVKSVSLNICNRINVTDKTVAMIVSNIGIPKPTHTPITTSLLILLGPSSKGCSCSVELLSPVEVGGGGVYEIGEPEVLVKVTALAPKSTVVTAEC